jgi:uncharacterized membrane protein
LDVFLAVALAFAVVALGFSGIALARPSNGRRSNASWRPSTSGSS